MSPSLLGSMPKDGSGSDDMSVSDCSKNTWLGLQASFIPPYPALLLVTPSYFFKWDFIQGSTASAQISYPS